jgi:hypothetical protein
MKRPLWLGTLFVALMAGGRGLCREPPCCDPPEGCFLKRLGPVGGWHPYGGGLLHWWSPTCFPRCGAPDDYCRKPLPPVCWPPYPCYYISGPPRGCSPDGKGP